MNFYNSTYRHYCGVDLHARSLYVCNLKQQGETLLHKEIPASPDALHRLIQPYLDDLVVGIECMHCWYWVADFCEEQGITFILGQALYMTNSSGKNLDSYSWPEGKSTGRTFQPIHGSKTYHPARST